MEALKREGDGEVVLDVVCVEVVGRRRGLVCVEDMIVCGRWGEAVLIFRSVLGGLFGKAGRVEAPGCRYEPIRAADESHPGGEEIVQYQQCLMFPALLIPPKADKPLFFSQCW